MPENKDPDVYISYGGEANFGDKVYNLADQKVGTLLSETRVGGWFKVRHEDGSFALLNGERMCSLEVANKQGWLKNAGE